MGIFFLRFFDTWKCNDGVINKYNSDSKLQKLGFLIPTTMVKYHPVELLPSTNLTWDMNGYELMSVEVYPCLSKHLWVDQGYFIGTLFIKNLTVCPRIGDPMNPMYKRGISVHHQQMVVDRVNPLM